MGRLVPNARPNSAPDAIYLRRSGPPLPPLQPNPRPERCQGRSGPILKLASTCIISVGRIPTAAAKSTPVDETVRAANSQLRLGRQHHIGLFRPLDSVKSRTRSGRPVPIGRAQHTPGTENAYPAWGIADWPRPTLRSGRAAVRDQHGQGRFDR